MKVLQVLPALQGGGVERGTLELAQALVAQGYESVVASAGGRLVETLETQGSRHVIWQLGKKSPLTLWQVGAFRRWLVAEAFDIVHVRSRMPGWITWLAWRKLPRATRPRLVTTVHGLHSVNRYSKIVTRGERVIAVSESIRSYIADNYPDTPEDKIRLIYRGIDSEEFPRGYRAPAAWGDAWYAQYPQLKDQQVLALPGRLTRIKGHLVFLKALARLKRDGLPVKGLVVGGEDPKRRAYADEVYALAKSLQLEQDVVFAGHRVDMRNIYSVVDVVVSLSTKPESFGRTVLEPLSMGIPVVGFAHGGVGEILDALYPEGAVPVNDHEALADKLKLALANALPKVAENDRFLLANMQDATIACYRELLDSPR